jgi:hypothetical protein
MGGLLMSSASAASPPQLPAALAPFASVLEANRAGAVPTAIQILNPDKPAVRVTDAHGSYRAFLVPLGSSGGAVLYQREDHPLALKVPGTYTTKDTRWVVDTETGEVVNGPHVSTATGTSFRVGGGAAPKVGEVSMAPINDICDMFPSIPALVDYTGRWDIEAVGEVDCSYPTYIIMGMAIDQAAYYFWHPVGHPSTNSARSVFALTDENLQPCIGLGYSIAWPFRDAELAYVEFNGLIDAGSTYGSTIELPCDDASLFTGTVG